MGYSGYSHQSASTRSASYVGKSQNQIFEQNDKRKIHEMMNPHGVTLRESRDSEAHPNSVPIIMGLDETGSMDIIPEYLARQGFPHIMSNIIEHGVPDPQIMFVGVGDHIRDDAPLQISQFESGDAELDTWLTRVWLEGNGGGNQGESYTLVHFFANQCVQTDAWDKRKQKGFLFTIGDERFHETIDASTIRHIMGNRELPEINSREEIRKAQERWNVFHIIPGSYRDNALQQWKEVLGENVIFVNNYKDIPQVISDTITKFNNYSEPAQSESVNEEEMEDSDDENDNDFNNTSESSRRR